jgi:DNA invertase Pin-like site-specific DNA recombinase
MKKIGYMRVSDPTQDDALQIDALTSAGCARVYSDDGISALSSRRPGLARARRALRPGDVFVVWAVDRAFRSTFEAIRFLDQLLGRDMQFCSLMQAIDTGTPEGRKWYIDIASWAEYESAVIARRTRAGMAAAKARGRHLGRLSDETIRTAHARLICGEAALASLAREGGVSEEALSNGFHRLGLVAQSSGGRAPLGS